MERVLSGVQPTDPPDMVAYWRRCRDRAARDVARAETVSVAGALGDGWFAEGVQ